MSLHVPPYPPPRYDGNGEVSATLRTADTPADFEAWGVTYTYLATEQSTGGEFGLYRIDLGPQAGGPGPHFHKAMSESFFVLSGHVRLYDGRDWTVGGQGDYLYIPPGGVHGFGNVSDEPASLLMLFTPGAPLEFYFEGLPKLGELSDDERQQFFDRNDNFFPEPPVIKDAYP